MTKDTLYEIKRLQANLAKHNENIDESLHYIKTQLQKPYVVPAAFVASLALSMLVMRKKKRIDLFSYLTSLTLGTNTIFRYGKHLMNIVNHYQTMKKKKLKRH